MKAKLTLFFSICLFTFSYAHSDVDFENLKTFLDNYYSSINQYAKSSNAQESKNLKSLIDDEFLSQSAILYNDLSKDGSEYFTAREYIDKIKVTFQSSEPLNFSYKDEMILYNEKYQSYFARLDVLREGKSYDGNQKINFALTFIVKKTASGDFNIISTEINKDIAFLLTDSSTQQYKAIPPQLTSSNQTSKEETANPRLSEQRTSSIQPKLKRFDYVDDVIQDGLIRVVKNCKWGAIDNNGKIVIPLIYDFMERFSHNYAVVVANDRFAMINNKNELRVQPFITRAFPYMSNATSPIWHKDYRGTLLTIDLDGNIVGKGYKHLEDQKNGYIAYWKNKGQYGPIDGYVDPQGIEISIDEYYKRTKLKKPIDYKRLKEKWIKKGIANKIYTFYYGLALSKKDDMYGFVNTEGEIVIPFKYESARSFENDSLMTGVKMNGQWGFIDRKGNLIIDFEYDNVADFQEELCMVNKNEKLGFIKRSNEKVIPLEYYSLFFPGKGGFENGTVSVAGWSPVFKKSNNSFLIDKTGCTLTNCHYQDQGYHYRDRDFIFSNLKLVFDLLQNYLDPEFDQEERQLFKDELNSFTSTNPTYKKQFANTQFDLNGFIESLPADSDNLSFELTNDIYGPNYAVDREKGKSATYVTSFKMTNGSNMTEYFIQFNLYFQTRAVSVDYVFEKGELPPSYQAALKGNPSPSKKASVAITKNYKKIGLQNIQNQSEILPAIFDHSSNIHHDLINLGIDQRWATFNSEGKMLLPFIFNYDTYLVNRVRFDYKEATIAVEKWGITRGKSISADMSLDKLHMLYIDDVVGLSGNDELKQYDEVGNLNESKGLREVKLNGKIGYLDRKDQVVIPLEYDEVTSYSKYDFILVRKANTWGVIDRSGKTMIPMDYDEIELFQYGASKNKKRHEFFRVKKNGLWGTIDYNNKVVVDLKYEELYYKEKGNVLLVSKNRIYGVIEIDGTEVLPLIYKDIGEFSEGLAYVRKKDKYGYVDRKGKLILPMEYIQARDFDNGKAYVYKNDKWFYINKSGRAIR